jgi:hypothetical protein
MWGLRASMPKRSMWRVAQLPRWSLAISMSDSSSAACSSSNASVARVFSTVARRVSDSVASTENDFTTAGVRHKAAKPAARPACVPELRRCDQTRRHAIATVWRSHWRIRHIRDSQPVTTLPRAPHTHYGLRRAGPRHGRSRVQGNWPSLEDLGSLRRTGRREGCCRYVSIPRQSRGL